MLLTCCTLVPPKIGIDAPSPVSTANLGLKTKIACVEVMDDAIGLKTSGILILDSRRMGENNRFSDFDTYFIDMSSGERKQVTEPGKRLDDFLLLPIISGLHTAATLCLAKTVIIISQICHRRWRQSNP